MTDHRVAAARLRWQGDQPYSDAFGDIYHAPDAAQEVARVFLAPSGLAPDSPASRLHSGARLTIGELGFGSGLNVIVAAEAALAAGAHLHVVSFESTPIGARDFAELARRRGTQHPLYPPLAAVLPPLIAGWHERTLAAGRIRLTLYYGDAATGLAELASRACAPLDAWFLDGFAPDRNPAMWSPEVFARLASLSGRGSTVATFTAAGQVRRGLAAVGFDMRRVDQRPHKRESLAGIFQPDGRTTHRAPRQATVIGGGLAGASTARELAERGVAVTLWDAAVPRLPATVLHGRLLPDGGPAALWRAHAYLHAAAAARRLAGFNPTGVLQTAATQAQATSDPTAVRAEAERLGRIAAVWRAPPEDTPWVVPLSAAEATARVGWPIATDSLWFPGGGIVETARLVHALLDHPDIAVMPARLPLPGQAGGPAPDQDAPVVLAAGMASRDASAAASLELAAVPGQIDAVDCAHVPRAPIVGAGWLVPRPGGVFAGSTYEYRPWTTEAASAANLAQLSGIAHTPREHHRGERATSSDRLPLAGALTNAAGEPVPGLWINAGHGSMGNVTSHYCAALVAAAICSAPPPAGRALTALLDPDRFRLRQRRRGVRFETRARS
ncbi:MAG: tRNA (5-methylaminomethyl-2-thiouridine)(34)-methyltransferase MnmD [Gammaproteobacteria bacterium]